MTYTKGIVIMALMFIVAAVAEDVVCKCQPLTLRSHRNRYRAYLFKEAANITGIEVRSQISKTRCLLGGNFGFIGSYVWVNGGCHATFRVCITPGKTINVHCRSHRMRMKQCRIRSEGKEISTVIPIRHFSRSPCIENYSYRVEGDSLYVMHGCVATFRVGLKSEVKPE